MLMKQKVVEVVVASKGYLTSWRRRTSLIPYGFKLNLRHGL